MRVLGADVDALDALARELSRASGGVRGAAVRIDAALRDAWWHGDDLAAFAAGWRRDRAALGRAAESLRSAAHGVRAQAAEQRQASSGTDALAPLLAPIEAVLSSVEHVDLVATLSAATRGSLVRELAVSQDRWDSLIAAGTIFRDGGASNVRYFDSPAVAGGGVMVVDLFIPFAVTGVAPALRGDDRGHADPLRDELDIDDSRMVLVLDRATGRGSVSFSETTVAWPVETTNEPRPISLRGDPPVVRGGLAGIEQTNQVGVTVDDDGSVHLELDVLNSITPVGSVDATLDVAAGDGGALESVRYLGDGYPSVGVYHYRPDGSTDVLLRHDSLPFTHVMPWWPDGVVAPDPGWLVEHLPSLNEIAEGGVPLPFGPLPVDLPGPFDPFGCTFAGIPPFGDGCGIPFDLDDLLG
jgi:hypothetical protein